MIDLTGKVFGRLTVQSFSHSDNGSVWNCECSCGNSVQAKATRLRAGSTKSCGCLKLENVRNLRPGNNKTHGLSKHPIKTVYDNMLKRCYIPGTNRYERYGGRGIGICDEWLKSRDVFYHWALSNGYEKGLTIDRIDKDGDYRPSNCRFVDWYTQANNTSRNRYLTWDGKTLTVSQWAREIGVRPEALAHRVCRGWELERIFTQPFRKVSRRGSKNA